MDGMFQRMLMPLMVETARRAGTAVEKMNELSLVCWRSTTICEPAQNLLDEFRSKSSGSNAFRTRSKGFRQFPNPEPEPTVWFGSTPEPEP